MQPMKSRIPFIWVKIKAAYYKFKKHIVPAGITAALAALFAGHIFTSFVIAGMTYIFWRNNRGVDVLVGQTQ